MSAFRFSFEGREIAAQPGQSLAAALIETGIAGISEARTGESRGLWCGMGICQECLVRVEGRGQVRACMTKAEPGLIVSAGRFLAPCDDRRTGALPVGLDDLPEERPDILVVGAGAAGLSAAIAARQAGCDVLVLDERSHAGGQYYKQAGEALPLDPQQREGADLIAEADRLGIRRWQGAEVWGAFAPDLLLAAHQGRTRRLAPRRLILATGAYERPWPVPGWTLPGVMTTGAAQTLWRSQRTLPGRRVLIAGAGPLNLQVALELARGGAEIVGLAEASDPPFAGSGRAGLALMLAGPRLAAQGLAQLLEARRRCIPLRWNSEVTEIRPSGGGLVAMLEGAAGKAEIAADCICLGYGFLPANELARALGVRHDYDSARGQLVAIRDADMMTDLPGLYVVGDCAGLGGAPAARDEGTIAGLAAAARLGRLVGAAVRQTAERRLARLRRFQAALWRLFRVPRPGFDLADAATPVCRCEGVTRAALDAAIADGSPELAEIKRRTRLGMGRCGGRNCGPLAAEYLARRAGRPLDAFAGFAPRAPAKPIRIADIVRREPLP